MYYWSLSIICSQHNVEMNTLIVKNINVQINKPTLINAVKV